MWYTGDEGGWAAANLLTGKVSPAGRLPITWPRRLEDGPANDPAHPERSSFGVDGRTRYAEGVHIGYRWFDRQRIEPLFPFGFGLSYTTFALSDLRLESDAVPADGRVRASLEVANTGAVAGAEVVQLYVGCEGSRVERAVRELRAFARVSLAPGERRRVELEVAAASLAYWDVSRSAWVVEEEATYRVDVGTSSRDLPLAASFRVRGAS